MRSLILLVTLGCGCGGEDPKVEPADTGHPGTSDDESPPDTDARTENLRSQAGDFASDYLTDSTYDRLVIEVDWVAGNEPDEDALELLTDTLDALCNKPGGVELVLDDELPAQGSPEWSVQQTEDMEVAWRDRYHDAATGTAALYYLYLDGNSAKDTDGGYVLGYAYHGSSLILFRERMDESAGLLGLLGASVEDTVVLHELGHVLGLVNNGVEMQTNHQDAEHEAHDESDECLMYWAAETDAIVDLLGSGSLDFDEACRADLAAAGGKRG